MSCSNNRMLVALAFCLVSGIAVGYLAGISLGTSVESPAAVVHVATVPVTSAAQGQASEPPECRRLREKVAILERELDGMAGEKDATRDDGGGSKMEADDGDSATLGEMAANCKTHGECRRRYPKLYENRCKAFAKRAKRVLANYGRWRRFMSAVDVSGLTEDERRDHERLLETYARVHELLRENLNSINDDERTVEQDVRNSAEMERLREKGREMMAAERNLLLGAVAENLGQRLGWQDDDVAEFAETLKAIADATARDPQR